jgi:hypothetical protein
MASRQRLTNCGIRTLRGGMSDAKLILDTNIVSYLMKGGSLAKAYAHRVQGCLLAIGGSWDGYWYIDKGQDINPLMLPKPFNG